MNKLLAIFVIAALFQLHLADQGHLEGHENHHHQDYEAHEGYESYEGHEGHEGHPVNHIPVIPELILHEVEGGYVVVNFLATSSESTPSNFELNFDVNTPEGQKIFNGSGAGQVNYTLGNSEVQIPEAESFESSSSSSENSESSSSVSTVLPEQAPAVEVAPVVHNEAEAAPFVHEEAFLGAPVIPELIRHEVEGGYVVVNWEATGSNDKSPGDVEIDYNVTTPEGENLFNGTGKGHLSSPIENESGVFNISITTFFSNSSSFNSSSYSHHNQSSYSSHHSGETPNGYEEDFSSYDSEYNESGSSESYSHSSSYSYSSNSSSSSSSSNDEPNVKLV